jgi:copper resistance protein B
MRAILLLVLLTAARIAHAQEDRFPLPPKDWPMPVMDQQPFAFLLLDRFEYQAKKGRDGGEWDVQGWFGGDYNKLWLKSQGQQVVGGQTEEADVQVLYARRIAPFWHVQAGVRSEPKPGPTHNYGVLAIQGLAPYWFNVEASAFVRSGEVVARLEAEYDQLLTQRLILQPRIESNLSNASDPVRGVGRGVNDVQLGLRLRYEIQREFAPYIGINWTRKLGDTASLARARGEDVRAASIVLGLRIWY